MSILAAVWHDPNWAIIAPIIAGILVTIGAELTGVVRHDEHRLDTISEMWWSLRNRLGPFSALLALPLAFVLSWTFWHLTFEGRRTKAARAEETP